MKLKNINGTVLMINLGKVIFLVLFTCLLTGCSVPVSINRMPETEINVPEKWRASQPETPFVIADALLDLLDNIRLKKYIDASLKNNFDIRAAIARLKASKYLLRGSKGNFLPQLNGALSMVRHNQDVDLTSGKRLKSETFKGTVDISWELDLWGKISDHYAAERYRHLAREADFIRFKDVLAARIIQCWIKGVFSAASVKSAAQQLSRLELLEEQMTRRYRRGLIALSELYDIRQKKRDTASNLYELKETYRRDIRAIEVLGGLTPDNRLFLDTALPEVQLAAIRGPAEVIQNRPDIQKGLAELKSAELLSRAAKKRLLPSVTLSGGIEKEGGNFKLLKGADLLWNIIGSLTQPLFSGGRLMAEYQAQSCEARGALREFQGTVLRALQEVENLIGREKCLSSRVEEMKKIYRTAEKKQQYHERRYKRGLTDYYTFMAGKIALNELKNSLDQLRTMRLINRVDLALAMGIGTEGES